MEPRMYLRRQVWSNAELEYFKKSLVTNIKAEDTLSDDALGVALNGMRTMAHSRPKKTAFELHYCGKPIIKLGNLLTIDF